MYNNCEGEEFSSIAHNEVDPPASIEEHVDDLPIAEEVIMVSRSGRVRRSTKRSDTLFY